MYETKYHRASTVSDAAAMLKNADDGKLLSGGQTLIPTMKQRLAAPSDLIDLRHIDEISGITKQADGSIRIGAATCHADVAGNADVRAALPGLADLAGHIGDPHVRHMGTLGGPSPTTTRQRTTRQHCWLLVQPSRPTSGSLPQRTSSPACSKQRWMMMKL